MKQSQELHRDGRLRWGYLGHK